MRGHTGIEAEHFRSAILEIFDLIRFSDEIKLLELETVRMHLAAAEEIINNRVIERNKEC
jgi:hypothetical protein